MRQKLGQKKIAQYRRLTGLDIIAGTVRGGTDHRVNLHLSDGSIMYYWPATGVREISDVRHDGARKGAK